MPGTAGKSDKLDVVRFRKTLGSTVSLSSPLRGEPESAVDCDLVLVLRLPEPRYNLDKLRECFSVSKSS